MALSFPVILAGFFEWIGESIINAFLVFLQLLARGVLSLELYLMQDLALKTPAIGPRWFETPFVVDTPGLTGPGGIVPEFYNKTLSLVLLGAGIGILVSGLLMISSFMPRLRAVAKDNLVRAPLFLFLAMAAPWLLQFFIDANTLLVGIAFNDAAEYERLRESLFDTLLSPRDLGDQFGQLMGLCVAAFAILIVVLELATRYGVIVFIGAISPLVMMGFAFNFTRGFSRRALQLFLGAVFLQGFAAIALRLMLELVVAYGEGGGIAPWALLSGVATLIAFLPKVLANASEAVSGGNLAMRLGAASVAGAGIMAGAGAGFGLGKGAEAIARRRLEKMRRKAGGQLPPGRAARNWNRVASFSRATASASRKGLPLGKEILVDAAYQGIGLQRPYLDHQGGEADPGPEAPGPVRSGRRRKPPPPKGTPPPTKKPSGRLKGSRTGPPKDSGKSRLAAGNLERLAPMPGLPSSGRRKRLRESGPTQGKIRGLRLGTLRTGLGGLLGRKPKSLARGRRKPR